MPSAAVTSTRSPASGHGAAGLEPRRPGHAVDGDLAFAVVEGDDDRLASDDLVGAPVEGRAVAPAEAAADTSARPTKVKAIDSTAKSATWAAIAERRQPQHQRGDQRGGGRPDEHRRRRQHLDGAEQDRERDPPPGRDARASGLRPRAARRARGRRCRRPSRSGSRPRAAP